MSTTEIDSDTMAKAAREALTRPGSYAAFDDRWYTTHGLVMTWADRGDAILAESNYLTALVMLHPDDIRWDEVARVYDAARDEYLAFRAAWEFDRGWWWFGGPLPGQDALPGLTVAV